MADDREKSGGSGGGAASDADAHAAATFAQLPALANADAWLVQRGRHLSTECLIEIGAVPFYASIAAGRIAALERGPQLMRPWRFAIRASARSWLGFWQPVPLPGSHDLLALAKRGELRLEGDLAPLMANLQYFKDLLAAPRRLFGGVGS
ncbi:MAG TPA: hypothetical protein VL244_09300 [Alphaproteobacteria bacterium]|nr:hypothetical protein [Alphaproteobacteria bacterium]